MRPDGDVGPHVCVSDAASWGREAALLMNYAAGWRRRAASCAEVGRFVICNAL